MFDIKPGTGLLTWSKAFGVVVRILAVDLRFVAAASGINVTNGSAIRAYQWDISFFSNTRSATPLWGGAKPVGITGRSGSQIEFEPKSSHFSPRSIKLRRALV